MIAVSALQQRHLFSAGLPGRSRGLSLVELMVVLSIAAILLGLALPSYTNLTATYRVKSASSELYLSLIRARGEAARLNQSITVTPNASGWQAGWTVTDTGSNTLYSEDASSGVSVSGGPTSLVYMSSGRIKGTTSPSFSIADATGHGEKRCVSVDLSGRPYVQGAAC